MTGAGTPAAVRRYVQRPLGTSILLLALVCTLWGLARRDSVRQEADYARGFAVDVRVAASYDGGELVPVRYRHPLTGVTETDVARWSIDPPDPGSTVRALADRNDPGDLLLAGDDYPLTTLAELGLGLTVAIVPVATTVLRRRGVGRLRGLMASDRPTLALQASISGTWPGGRRARLHLYPADARPGARPLCSIPLLMSHGLPAGGAFAVEAKGSPRPLGRVAVRHGEEVLWPRGRASSRTAPEPMPVPMDVPAFALEDARPAVLVGSWLRYAARGLLAAGAALVIVGVTAAVTLVHWRRALDLERHGVEVVAEITEAEVDAYTLGVTYTLPDETTSRDGRAAVELPEEWDVGDRYPAVVDPDAPGRLRLLTEPYDPRAPIIWSTLPAAVALPWVGWSIRRWRSQRRAAAGPWMAADAWIVGQRSSPTYGAVVEVAVARPGTTVPSCLVRLPADRWRHVPSWVRGRLDLSEMAAVGDPLVVRAESEAFATVRAARIPRST